MNSERLTNPPNLIFKSKNGEFVNCKICKKFQLSECIKNIAMSSISHVLKNLKISMNVKSTTKNFANNPKKENPQK